MVLGSLFAVVDAWLCLLMLGVWGFDCDSCGTAGGMALIEGVYVSARGNRECGNEVGGIRGL